VIQPPEIERVLFTEEQISQRIGEVAAEISEKFRGRDLKLIGVLKGSVFFLTALARAISVPVKIDFLAISSFSGSADINLRGGAPGMVRIAKDLDDAIENEDVLLIEDIVDTGFTTRYLLQTLAGRGPRSLAICTLLDRTVRRIVQVPVAFRCFEIPDRFVVGCGLDYKQLYRNLGYIAVMNPASLQQRPLNQAPLNREKD
jgi:hypoxanthine phosphoribosyltransferase